MAYTPSNMIGSGRDVNGFSNLDLALKLFSGEVLTSFEKSNIFLNMVQRKTISGGKSSSFPVIGTYTDAIKVHQPGDNVVPSTIASGERVISIDKLKYASVFTDRWEEAVAHYETRSQYSTEIGRKLANQIDLDVISTLRSCLTATPEVGQPAVNAVIDAELVDSMTVKEQGDKLVESIFAAQAELDSKDIPGERMVVMHPKTKYKLVMSGAINKDYTANTNGGLDTGNIDMVAGLKVLVSNNVSEDEILIFTKHAIGALSLLDIKTEIEYKIEKQGTLIVSSYAMGYGILNPGCVLQIDTSVAVA